jgi:hypothetical protein
MITQLLAYHIALIAVMFAVSTAVTVCGGLWVMSRMDQGRHRSGEHTWPRLRHRKQTVTA